MAIARGLILEPKVLLLDEPFGGLSAEDAFRVTQLIKTANRDYGVTIIIVEHKLKLLANLVERIVVLDQGQIIASGTPKDISQDQTVIAAQTLATAVEASINKHPPSREEVVVELETFPQPQVEELPSESFFASSLHALPINSLLELEDVLRGSRLGFKNTIRVLGCKHLLL